MEPKTQEEADRELQRLMDSKPQMKDFKYQEDFEEAYGFWMSRQGRQIALVLRYRQEMPPNEIIESYLNKAVKEALNKNSN